MSAWILQISSGTGPEDVRMFVARLATLLAVELGREGIDVHSRVDVGDEAKPSSVQLRFSCPEERIEAVLPRQGTYCLLARNVERGRKARKRWFAAVALFAQAKHRALEVCKDDVRVTTCRAGGPGGQHVNRTESAVRVVHEPTGIAVRVASERSQHLNRQRALELLTLALRERSETDRAKQAAQRRAQHHELQRGAAVRTFRLDARSRLVELTTDRAIERGPTR